MGKSEESTQPEAASAPQSKEVAQEETFPNQRSQEKRPCWKQTGEQK